MKFSCTQENLHRGLQVASHVTSKNVNLPILHNIHIEAKDEGITLTATNLEIGVRVTIRGKVDEPGSVTVPAQVFSNYISLVNSERVDVQTEDNTLLVHAGNQNTKIRGESAEEFPLIPSVERSNEIHIPTMELKEGLQQVLFSASKDSGREVLTGVYCHIAGRQLTVAATNGHRLAERVITLPKEQDRELTVVVPAHAFAELVRVLPDTEENVNLYVHDNQILCVVAGVEFTITRLIEERFPDYKQVIPHNFRTHVIVDRDKFMRGIKAASLFSKSGIHDINIHIAPESQELTLTTVNNQLGENVTKVEAEITGDSNNTIYNYRYVLDGVTHIPSEKIKIDLIDNSSPGVFRPNDSDAGEYLYTISPIQQ